jgi:hypothetical protein
MKVRALRIGYYDHVRRREGDVFELKPVKGHKREGGKLVPHVFTVEEQFSHVWMEKVAKNTPEKTSTAQQALNAASADLKAIKHGVQVDDSTGSTDVI